MHPAHGQRLKVFQIPSPEGGFEIFQLFSISPMQNLEQILALLSVEHHGFETLLDEREIPERKRSLCLITLTNS